MHDRNDDDEQPSDGGLPLMARLQPGDAVGEFVVDAFHAAGGWSDVYRAHHCARDLGPVALKVMPLGLGAPPPPVETLAGIPHLVEVFASGVAADRGLAYVAMRFVAGTPLDRRFAAGSGPPPPRVRRQLVLRCAEIAGALAALHARGIVHRDVKPANILIEEAAGSPAGGRAVLVDLGCARDAGTASPVSTIYATLPYAAPELLLGLDVDGRADVFALGLCLHDLLAGRTPDRRGRRPAAGMEPLAALVPDIEPDLAAIVAEAVAPDRAQRYPGAAALAADLRCFGAGAPPSVRPRSLLRRVVRCWQRHPAVFFQRTTLLLLWAALTAALVAAGSSCLRNEQLRAAMAASLAQGDLQRALRTEDRRAGLFAFAGGPSPIASVAAADPDLAPVLAALREDRVDHAHARAAFLLSRDGVARHGVLAAWLLAQASDGVPRAASILSQVLFDHPVQDRAGPAVARLRDGLLVLLAQDHGDRALHALAALGGVAGPGDLGALVPVWLDVMERHRAPVEVSRLGIEVMNRISARGGADAAGGAEAGEQAAAAFVQVGAWLGRQPDLAARRPALEVPLDSWLITLRRLCARAGAPRLDLAALRLPWPATVFESAIAGDAAPLERVPGTDPILDDPYRFGFSVGLLADGPAAVAFRLESSAAAAQAASGRWRQCFAAGERAGRLALRAPEQRFLADAGARLADQEPPSDYAVMAAQRGAELPQGVIARWRFLGPEPECGGTATSVATRAVRRGTDEVETDSHFLCLGIGGVSALELRFDEPTASAAKGILFVSAQKGQRGALPYGGEAGLEILIDGRPVIAIRDLGAASAGRFEAPLGKLEFGRPRTVEIRLQADSNTTVRLFEAWIE